jgi:tetratricopeptide (TPR) repeat protein
MASVATSLAPQFALKEWIHQLQTLLDKADFDNALTLINTLTPEDMESSLVAHNPTDPLATLRARCLISEVRDYAGQTAEATACILEEGIKAIGTLKMLLHQPALPLHWSPDDFKYLQQQCWACLHLGMAAFYRKQLYKKAHEIFMLVANILQRLHQHLPCLIVLSRSHYCLGLVAREQHRFYDAREHFSTSLEYAGRRLDQKHAVGQAIDFLEYNIGRALGLGMAWLAYSRAAIAEANGSIVAARLLLQDKGVRYIRAYVDIVHACAERSRAETVEQINNVIRLMQNALMELGDRDVLLKRSAGHIVYALRATSELARAHLSAARIYAKQKKTVESKQHLQQALNYINLVRKSLRISSVQASARLPITDRRTYCNVLITASRVLRERKNFRGALALAERAAHYGMNGRFTKIDSWIALGEGHYYCQEYSKALECFLNVREDKRAQTNPKVIAVCDLHLARCHVALGQLERAQQILANWKGSGRLGGGNTFVRGLEAEINESLTNQEAPYSIPAKADLTADFWIEELKYWLATSALKRVGGTNDKAAANLIGKSKKTLHNWVERK